MADYDLLKQGLLTTVDSLKPLVREEQRQALDQIGTKLKEEAFNLVILGQFKRGKSTFINALLGEDLLPTAIVQPPGKLAAFLRGYFQQSGMRLR